MLKGHDDHVITCLQFSGDLIVSGSDDNTLKVWSAITGKVGCSGRVDFSNCPFLLLQLQTQFHSPHRRIKTVHAFILGICFVL